MSIKNIPGVEVINSETSQFNLQSLGIDTNTMIIIGVAILAIIVLAFIIKRAIGVIVALFLVFGIAAFLTNPGNGMSSLSEVKKAVGETAVKTYEIIISDKTAIDKLKDEYYLIKTIGGKYIAVEKDFSKTGEKIKDKVSDVISSGGQNKLSD